MAALPLSALLPLRMLKLPAMFWLLTRRVGARLLLPSTGVVASMAMMTGCVGPFSPSATAPGDSEAAVSGSVVSGEKVATTGDTSGNPQAAAPTPAATPGKKDSLAPGRSPAQTLPNAANARGDTYEFALNKAYSAAKLSQSARAISDWEFVVSRWQEAINLLKTIEATDPRAPGKIAEYNKNLAYAQRQTTQVPTPPKPIRIQAPRPSPQASPPVRVGRAVAVPNSNTGRPATAAGNSGAAPASAQSAGASAAGTKVPIRRRFGGIPIIVVQINGQGFPMMVDTGASTTVVTQAMANTLGLTPTGTVRANTPSQQGAVFKVTQLDRIKVGNLEARNLGAAIAPSMDVGLLGQNFFGAYAVTITRTEVIFSPQS